MTFQDWKMKLIVEFPDFPRFSMTCANPALKVMLHETIHNGDL